jgi:cell division septum initiation protein DivIVA
LIVMSEQNSGYLTPEEITNKSFMSKRRGVDPDEVQRHLSAAAATVNGMTAERSSLSDQVAALEERLRAAKNAVAPAVELDEDELTERLGKDAARVLAEARAAAADRIAEAEAQADDIRAAAEEIYAVRSVVADGEANRIRESAESLLAERRDEAEKAAADIIARAEADAEVAQSDVAQIRQSADADVARIIREAELTRRQILEDLARRRSAARRQIEQLRAGRERLLASHETVRRALDEISEELTISMSEARAAAETAGHTVPNTTVEELEAEIETARLTGLLDTGPVPVVKPTTVHPPRTLIVPTATIDADDTPDEAVDSASGADTSFSEDEASDAAESTTEVADQIYDVTKESEPTIAVVDEAEEEVAAAPALGLAEVVQLDRARSDVDTATHPATGRDASTGRSGVRNEAAQEPKAPRLEAVKNSVADDGDVAEGEMAAGDMADDESVGDLFASLRSSTPEPKEKPAKKAAAKKSTAKNKPKAARTKKAVAQPDIDSSELARRLKRVLADEQSRAMSTLKAAKDMPGLDGLLGDSITQSAQYWSVAVEQLADVSESDDTIRAPIDEMVDTIRRRVGAALNEAGDDSEGAITALRNVYREVKTQRVGVCADSLSRMAAGRSSDRS